MGIVKYAQNFIYITFYRNLSKAEGYIHTSLFSFLRQMALKMNDTKKVPTLTHKLMHSAMPNFNKIGSLILFLFCAYERNLRNKYVYAEVLFELT